MKTIKLTDLSLRRIDENSLTLPCPWSAFYGKKTDCIFTINCYGVIHAIVKAGDGKTGVGWASCLRMQTFKTHLGAVREYNKWVRAANKKDGRENGNK